MKIAAPFLLALIVASLAYVAFSHAIANQSTTHCYVTGC